MSGYRPRIHGMKSFLPQHLEGIDPARIMFICVSLNPAIDKRLVVERLVPGKIHRVRSVEAHAGGKSAHVAMVLRALDETPHWIGPCGGATGTELASGLRSLGIETHPFPVRGTTRTNLEILDE